MPHEYELVQHLRFDGLKAFLVRLQSRTPHIHSDLEIGLVLDSPVTLRIDGTDCVLEKGDMYLINPMELHEFHSEGSGALVLAVQLSAPMLDTLRRGRSDLRFTGGHRLREQFSGQEERYTLLQTLCAELGWAYLGEEPHREVRCFSLAAQLFCLLECSLPCEEPDPAELLPIRRRQDRILSITGYIDENFHRKLLLEEIAQREKLTMVYLSHFFKETLGMSFQEYLKGRRFEQACLLLETTDRTVMDISVSCGFSDVRYLTKTFLERTGCTPKEYRTASVRTAAGTDSDPINAQQLFTREDALVLLTPMRRALRRQIEACPVTMLWP